jgi:hypothetical protein
MAGNRGQTLGQPALLTRDLPTLPALILQCLDHERKITEGTANHRRDCISEAIRLLEELCLLTNCCVHIGRNIRFHGGVH